MLQFIDYRNRFLSNVDSLMVVIRRLLGRSLHHFCTELIRVNSSQSLINPEAEVPQKPIKCSRKLDMFKHTVIYGSLLHCKNFSAFTHTLLLTLHEDFQLLILNKLEKILHWNCNFLILIQGNCIKLSK
jgi:hypothetical protein